jgi:diguanylate cyclase (GGDEF)-like protein/putative nucleotidyltransferase with HDIG domain
MSGSGVHTTSEPLDPLSRMLPKAAFAERLEREFADARACAGALSLLVVDIDHFKSINDAFGHARGDEILAEFASRLTSNIRRTDVVVRYGGDEFVVLLPGAGKNDALGTARRILDTIHKLPFPGDPPLNISVSIGAATVPDDAATVDELFKRADTFSYEAKRRGRGQVVGDAGRSPQGVLLPPLSRVIERDPQLNAVSEFLAALPQARRGSLSLVGPQGAGRSRMLSEVDVAARMLGYRVMKVRGSPALRGRMYGALLDAWPDHEDAIRHGPDALAAALAESLRQQHRSVLLITVDGVSLIDEAGRELLKQLVGSPRLPCVGVVCTAERPLSDLGFGVDVSLAREVTIPSLSAGGLRSWIRTALHWDPPGEFVQWLHAETGGLPERIQRGLARLLALSILHRDRSGWCLDEKYEQLSLGAWLDSNGRSSSSTLPSVLSSIIGRDREVREVKTLLRTERLITLHGPGGFGKTRLALQVAAEVAEELEHEVCFVSLAPLGSAEAVVPAVAEALRVSLHASSDPKQQLLEKLRDRQVLLVLDNFEHLAPCAPLVSEILAGASKVRVLVTSRECLGLHGETVYAIRGIGLPLTDELDAVSRSPAARLFAQQAARHAAGFRLTRENAAAVAQTCRVLQGGPLALEIAASLMRVLDCQEILHEVRRDLDSLASGRDDAEDRHRSLRAVFDYSWNLLSAEEQRVWAGLSLFHGGFIRDAARDVAGATLPMLVALASKSLLYRAENGRFEVHETLRRFASEKLAADPDALLAAETRYANFFAEFVYSRGARGPDVDLARMKRETAEEIENIRASFRWMVEHGHLEPAERCAKGLFRFYDLYGWYAEGEELFRWGVSRIEEPRLRALLRARQAYFLGKLGDFEPSERLHRRSVRSLKRIGRSEEAALSLYSLGQIATQRGAYDRAERLYRQATKIYRAMGSSYGLALCENEWGVIAVARGDHEGAKQRFGRSLALRQQLGDMPGQARCLNNLAMIADMQGSPREARSLFEQSLVVSRRAGDRQSVGNALNNIGVLILHAGRKEGSRPLFEEARRFLEEALEVYEEIGTGTGASVTLYNLGDIAYHLEEDEAAEELFLEVLRRSIARDALPMLLTTFVGIAILVTRRGDDHLALRLLSLVHSHPATREEDRQRAGELLRELAARVGVEDMETVAAARESVKTVAVQLVNDRVLMQRARPAVDPEEGPPPAVSPSVAIEEGQLAERGARHTDARRCYESALRGVRSAEHAAMVAPLLRWIGRTHASEGNLAAAEDCLEASLAVAEAAADRVNVAHAVNLQGIVHFYRGELEAAARIYLEARSIAEEAGEIKLMAMLDQNLGVLANIRGDLPAALSHYQSCLAGLRSLGADESTIDALNNIGMLYTDLRRWEEAEQAFEEALHLCERHGGLQVRIMVEVNVVELRIEQERFDAARLACDAAFEMASQAGHARVLGELHKHYGVIYRSTNHLYLAETHLKQAARIAEEHDNLLLAAETAREQADLYWRLQRNQETLQCLNRAHRAFFQLRARRDLAATDRRIGDLESFFLTMVRQWGESIESADQYTQGHCERVADFACALARANGMDEKTLFWFRMGALLHDVGKIVVPLEVLNKPGKLTPEERAIIEQHPDAGVEVLADVDFPWDVRPMVRHHHERWEGNGYPTGIAGEEIPLSARILCIADVYDALTSDRPYRPGFTHEKAMDIMENGMQGTLRPGAVRAVQANHRSRRSRPTRPARPVAAGEVPLMQVA